MSNVLPRPGLTQQDRLLGGLWGAAVGDALGVPVEFRDRASVQSDPVTGMRGHGTHGQLAGTWSDDTSMLLCCAESLVKHEFAPEDMARRFVRWYDEGYWTPRGCVFDIGGTTASSLNRIRTVKNPEEAGGTDAYDNGNGSLMRILPVPLRFAAEDTALLLDRTHRVSCLTHGHRRSQMACGLYALIVRGLLRGEPPRTALETAGKEFTAHYAAPPWADQLEVFRTLLGSDISAIPEARIGSGGYVMETLLAAVWCLLTTRSFTECVLRAVNLGGDTDTTGCVAGGLAGVCYGVDAIPQKWLSALARADDLAALFQLFAASAAPAVPLSD